MLKLTKTINLGELGDVYEGVTLVFRCIRAKDLADLTKAQEVAKDDPSKQIPFFIDIITKYFESGTQGDEKVTAEDMQELDAEALIFIFTKLAGVTPDPKQETPLTNPSSTE